MARLNKTFDATQVDPTQTYEPVPAGFYTAIIVDSNIKENQKRTGENLTLKMEVVEGPYQGRYVWDRITMSNSTSSEAEGIGARRLSAVCHACGVFDMDDTEQLHNIPIIVQIVMRDQTQDEIDRYGRQNDVKGYKGLEGATPAVHSRPDVTRAPVSAPPTRAPAAQAPARAAPAARAPVATAPRAPAAAPANKPAWARPQ